MMTRRRRIEAALRIGCRLSMLGVVAASLGGCTTGGVTQSFFVDPSKYDLYDCKQLTTARVAVDARVVEMEKLIAKAESGAAGGLVSGLAYQSDYSAARAQRNLIDQKMVSNNCRMGEPSVIAPQPPPATTPKSKTKR